MKKTILLALTGILMFLLESCASLPFLSGSDSAEESANTASTSSPEVDETQPSDSLAPESTETPQAQTFSQPTTPAEPKLPTVTNLLPSSQVDQRVGDVSQGRTDPFALVPINPGEAVVSVKLEPGSSSTIPGVTPPPPSPRQSSPTSVRALPSPPRQIPSTRVPSSPLPPKPSGQSTARRGNLPTNKETSTIGIPPATPSTSGNTGTESGSPRFIPQLPALPQPQLAQGIVVTGVIEVQGEAYAIIKAPSEPYSRHVKVGQYISNGQVLVKRIETNGTPEPIIVFEELGMEITRVVGDQTVAVSSKNSTSSKPFLPPVPISLH